MDDETRQSSPEQDTGPMPSVDDQAENQSTINNVRPSASSTEFTQMAERNDQSRTYAIPDPDPSDFTVQGIPQRRDLNMPIYIPEVPESSGQTTQNNYNTSYNAQTVAGQPIYPASPASSYNPPNFTPPPPPTSYPTSIRKQQAQHRSNLNWLWVLAAMILFSVTVTFSIGAFVVLRLSNGIIDDTTDDPIETAVSIAQNASLTPNVTLVAGKAITTTPAPTATVGLQIQPWDGKRRLTILMMGIDKRPNEKGNYFRTDSLMIVSIDPKAKSVGILSIPRDLFVDIPSDTVVTNPYGLQRVNAAYVIGELARPGYGPTLAVQTIQYNMGIRINNFVVYEFGTVISGIDMIGGIDINVKKTLRDDTYPNMYYGYDPVYIPAGQTHMDGQLALKYGRTRHQSSDFDRAERQQEVVLAARDKILKDNLLPDLLLHAPQIWEQFNTSMKTDLTLDQIMRLVVYLKDVPKESIKRGLVDLNYCIGMNYNGQDILVPQRAKLGPLMEQVFGANYNG
jgi:polyisoprenyl-teichoic acid--peptidoglycan teichoic acid transferase